MQMTMSKPRTTTVAVNKPTAQLTKGAIWRAVLRRVGSDKPDAINAYFKTPEGARLYEQYQNAPADLPSAPTPKQHQSNTNAATQLEALARQAQQPGETFEQAFDRTVTAHPELYAQHVAEVRGVN